MNWQLAIEKNREALTRILAMLVAMAGIAGEGGARSATLPRHLHRFVLRLLRPAEAATRRLIIIAAQGLTVQVRQHGPRRPKAVTEPNTINVLDGLNGSIVSVPVVLQGPVGAATPSHAEKSPSIPAFRLLDPLKRALVRRAEPEAIPQIRLLGVKDDTAVALVQRPDPSPTHAPPAPDDPLDAGSIHRRLNAISRVLEDLPWHAQRMARWQARRDAAGAMELAGAPDRDAPDEPDSSSEVIDPCPSQGASLRRREIAPSTTPRRSRRAPMRPCRAPLWRTGSGRTVRAVPGEFQRLAIRACDRWDTS
jgi:hypothetical protein